jgi:protein-L-isoaspartate(D-aspartate) O-methyltransferase
MKNNTELIKSMRHSRVLKSPQIIQAFEKIDRKYFVQSSLAQEIYEDYPLPIGKNQTISQPSTVAFMLELLNTKKGNKVLDIGSGSGWTVALLSEIVGENGSVRGLERVEKLIESAQKNLKQFGFKNSLITKASGNLGCPNNTFDRILVSASAPSIPTELFAQLKKGGILVIPVQNSIFKFKKFQNGEIGKEEFYGFKFVPLIY